MTSRIHAGHTPRTSIKPINGAMTSYLTDADLDQTVLTVAPMFIQGAVQNLEDRFENVSAGEKHADHGDGSVERQDRIRTPNHEELRDEAVEAWQAERCHGREYQDTPIEGNKGEQPSILVEIPRVCPLIDHANQKEHASRGQAVVEHLQYRTVHGDLGILRPMRQSCRGNRQNHEAHVIHRGNTRPAA